jgi:hypothetical protein
MEDVNMATEYEVRTLKKIFVPKGEPIFSEQATTIEIVDEAAGEFVEISQDFDDTKRGTICIDPTEWPVMLSVIDEMIANCRKND